MLMLFPAVDGFMPASSSIGVVCSRRGSEEVVKGDDESMAF